jgi:hypothetical protein
MSGDNVKGTPLTIRLARESRSEEPGREEFVGAKWDRGDPGENGTRFALLPTNSRMGKEQGPRRFAEV